MTNKIIKVIHMAPLGTGGITNLTININRELDPQKVRFDYLVFHNRKEWAEDQIIELGAKKQVVDIEGVHNPIKRSIRKIRDMVKLFKREEYDVVHVDASTPYDVVVAIAAKLAGVPVIVMHSHNDSYKKGNKLRDAIMPFCKKIMLGVVTDYIAISEPAAQFMFPKKIIEKKKYRIVKNAIRVENYCFDLNDRRKIRSELGIDDEIFVLGNVSRFVYQKNHDFMFRVFKELKKINSSAKLLLVGEGILEKELKEKAEDEGIKEDVIFYGPSKNIPLLLNAMDAFIFPSRFEGLGIVAIEAQVSGLPTWCAETIPEIANTTEQFKRINGWNPAHWAKIIYENSDIQHRHSYVDEVKAAGYDIKIMAKDMEEFYIKRVKEENENQI